MICNKKGWHLLPIIIGENDMNGVNQDAIIADEIRFLIDEGFYQQGDKLPSELELCKKYNVQKMTIRSSLQILKDEGIIKAKKNSGHYVERKRIKKNIRFFSSTKDLLEKNGLSSEVEIISINLIQATKEIFEKTGIYVGQNLYCLNRLRTIEGKKAMIEKSFLIADYFPELDKIEFINNSLYETIKKHYGIQIDRSESELYVSEAGKEESDLLDIDEKFQVVKECSLNYDYENRLVEYSVNTMLMELYYFER